MPAEQKSPDRKGSPLRVGLTGGIASGKSTVARLFESLGATVVDTDVIAREVVVPGSPGLDDVRRAFGDDILQADGSLDRQALRELIFADAGQRAALEAILHPRIRDAAYRQAEAARGPYVVIVVPLLVESPMKAFMDRVAVVDCSEETQLQRLLARDAESEARAKRMIAAQASRDARLSIADDVIDNDGELDETREQVRRLHESYLDMAKPRP